MNTDLEFINEKLLGKFISRFSLGDTWDMWIGDYYLSAHTIEFKDEDQITKAIKENYEEFNYSIDKEDISKSAIMAANLRKEITGINLDDFKNLIIDFKKGSSLKILTNTKIVDWQWCINKSGKDPYQDYEIACFLTGEISRKK